MRTMLVTPAIASSTVKLCGHDLAATVRDGDLPSIIQSLRNGSVSSEALTKVGKLCTLLAMPTSADVPYDSGQNPVISVPLGFYSTDRKLTRGRNGMIAKGNNIP